MIAIDLGSNTIRVVVLDCESGVFGKSFEKIVKTADGLHQTNRVNDATLRRVIAAICEAKESIDFDADRVRAVTTEAIRRADNSEEILRAIEAETRVVFEIISGDDEAKYTLLAVEHRLNTLAMNPNAFVLVDIGGASTELIFSYRGDTITKSFPIGIVTIAQSYDGLAEMKQALPQVMSMMLDFTTEVYDKHGSVDHFIATAGTPTTVAAMKLGQTYATYDAEQINGTQLSIEDLDRELAHLLGLDFAQRELMVGVGRSDLISAGILIFRYIFQVVNMKSCIVIDDGLREGVALQACNTLG